MKIKIVAIATAAVMAFWCIEANASSRFSALLRCEVDTIKARITASYDAAIMAAGKASNDAGPLFDQAQTCLSGALQPALSAAEGHPDLIEAVKSYYVEAQAYVGALRDLSGGQRAYDQRAKEAADRLRPPRERLKMEATLAGM